MGLGNGNIVFLGPCQDGGKDRMGRPGSRETEIGFDTRLSKTASARAAVW